jgi:hypothetical protein
VFVLHRASDTGLIQQPMHDKFYTVMSSRRAPFGLADNGVITEGIDVVLGFTVAFTREEGDRFANVESQCRLSLEVGEGVVLARGRQVHPRT